MDIQIIYLTILSGIVILAAGQAGNQCTDSSSIGSDRNAHNGRRDEFLYINTARASDCWGTITSFSYCYYAPRASVHGTNEVYRTNFGVYRPSMEGGVTVYTLVSRVLTIERSQSQVDDDLDWDDDEYDEDDICLDLSLTEPVTVNPGDVLGACVFDPPDITVNQLDIVRRAGPNNELERADTSGCTSSALPLTVTSASTVMSRVLHLYATIEPIPETDPPTTQPPNTTEDPTTAAPITEDPTTAAPIITTTGASTTTIKELPTKTSTGDYSLDSSSSSTASSTQGPQLTPLASNNGGNAPVIATTVSVVFITLVGILIVLVVILALRRYRKKAAVNLTSHGHLAASSGFDNMLYGEAKGEKFDHGYEMVGDNKPKENTEHTYEEYGFSESYTYADIGPTNEEQVNLYETPMQAMALRSPLDSPANRFSELLSKNKEEDIYEHISPYQAPASRQGDLYGQLKSLGARNIPRSEIQIVGHLGSGQFGSVEQGAWKRQETRPVDVALKSLNKISDEDKIKFLQEAAIMAQFKHPIVIMLYGVVIRGDPVLIVTELAGKGDLRDYLLSLQPKPGELVSISTSELLLKFSQQIAFGMQYLAAKGFVHRDLAARNVLLTSDNICKISDFGMSRDLEEEKYYVSHGGMVPVKWTAPEAIEYKKYSTASDVWAYGCLLYEIWSLGHKPFEGTCNRDVIRIVNSGKRLSPPPGCPKMIYELMSICWSPKTSQRPGFRDIVLTLVGSEELVLNIPEEDSSTNPLAGVLGAPLEAGENMYSELQRRHL